MARENGIYRFGWGVDAGWHVGGGVVLAAGGARLSSRPERGDITCTGLKVVDEEGVLRVGLMDEGIASVLDKDGKAKVAMTVDDYGNGAVSTWDKNG